MTSRVEPPRAGLPNPLESRAVLVGVSNYTTLPHLPAVANNVTTLTRVFTDPELWGLPGENCVTLLNPASSVEVVEAVHDAASKAREALVFYFAGHGLLDARSDLFLALPDADKDQLFRAVRYDDIRQQIVDTALGCYGKVVLLDCCFSGRALVGHMGGQAELADHARADGTYLMTASAETVEAQAPPGEEYTAFTGALLGKLLNGLPDGRDVIDMETLFYHVRADLKAQLRPVPQQRTRNEGNAIALVRNRRRSSAASATPVTLIRELPQPPSGFETVLRRSPRMVLQEVDNQRASGATAVADQLLVACAALRHQQQVAATIGLLRAERRLSDLQLVFRAVARRSPNEVLLIIDALTAIDLAAETVPLLHTVGAGPVTDVAEVARQLRAIDHAADVTTLLTAALDVALAGSSLIGLINALWVAGLREEVDSLITTAVIRLSGAEIIVLADELRAVGREQTAFGLYAMSADAMAARSAEDIAQLCQAMAEAECPAEASRIAEAKIASATDTDAFLDIASAFWHLGQDEHADRAIAHAATTLPTDDVLVLASELREVDRTVAGFDLCVRAALIRPADGILEIVAALRDEGWPVDAKNLLETAVYQAPWTVVSDLLGMCTQAERERLLDVVIERSPRDIRRMLANIDTAPDGPLSRDVLLARTAAVADETVAAALLLELPDADADALFSLLVRAGNDRLSLVIAALRSNKVVQGRDPVRTLLLRQPVQYLPSTLQALVGSSLDDYVDIVLAHASTTEAGIAAVGTCVAQLRANGTDQSSDDLVRRLLDRRSNRELKDIIAVFRQQGQLDTLDVAAEWAKVEYAPMGMLTVNDILKQLGLGEFRHR